EPGIPMSQASSSPRADAIYRMGPETLTAEASAIVTGPVARYAKQVTQQTQPGPDGVPLQWVVTGQVERPQVLKAPAPPAPLSFPRAERAMFMPPDGSALHWEATYGDLAAGDQVVLFFGDGDPKRIRRVVPSGNGERDLASLVREVVAIQAAAPAEQVKRWLAYVNNAPSEEGRKAALRSLIVIPVDWDKLEPAVDKLLRA